MKTLLLSSLLVLPLLALAAETGVEGKRQKCLHRASTSSEMRQCEYRAFREATAELKKLQADMVKGLKHSDLEGQTEIEKRFSDSNRAWAKLRDSQCQFKSAEVLNGSEESLLLASCSVNMTLDRIKELKSTRL